jgi:hypothetical protein
VPNLQHFGARNCPHLLARSGNTIAHTTLSPTATIAFEKSHIRAIEPALRAGTTIVSPAEHLLISSDAFASLSKKPADTGRQYIDRRIGLCWGTGAGVCASTADTMSIEINNIIALLIYRLQYERLNQSEAQQLTPFTLYI